VTDFCERCVVVCRRAKTQLEMAATLYPLLLPPTPWHIFGFDYLRHLPVSNGFDRVLIVIDHPTRITYFLPCTKSVIANETASLFYIKSTHCTDCPECLRVIATRNSSLAFGRHFGDALARDSTCVLADAGRQMD
jgi:hypothetical protein